MVRPNELGYARRGALEKLAARNGGAKAWHITGRVVGLDPDDSRRVIIDFDGARISVSSGPWKLVPGALALVAVDTVGRPVRVEGPLTDRPVELDPGLPGPAPIIPMEGLAPRELTEAEAKSIRETVVGLEGAKADLDAAGETLGNLSTALEATKGEISAVDAKADSATTDVQNLQQWTSATVANMNQSFNATLASFDEVLDGAGLYEGPSGVAAALKDYLSVPLHALTVEDNRAPSGAVKAALYDVVVTEQLLATKGVITSQLLADGAVTARTLNVVPKESTGGVEILPEGIRVIPAGEDGAAISLRANEENWLYFAEDGSVTFSVSPAGELVAQEVTANDSLTYRGVELADVINELPRGVIAAATLADDVTVGTSPARLLACTFQTPPDDRMIRIGWKASLEGAHPRTFFELRQAASSTVSSTNSRISQAYNPKRVDGYHQTVTANEVYSMAELHWPKDTTITMGLFLRSLNAGEDQRVRADWGTRMWIEDVGPAVEVDTHAAYVPPSSTGGGTSTGSATVAAKKLYTRTFAPRWGQSYQGSGAQYNWKPAEAFHGRSPYAATGLTRSYISFDRNAITAFCSGAEVVSARIYLHNDHTYASNGANVTVRAHGHHDKPARWAGDGALIGTYTYKRGQARWLGFNDVRNGFKSGAVCGLSLNPGTDTTQARYAYFNIAKARLEITIRK